MRSRVVLIARQLPFFYNKVRSTNIQHKRKRSVRLKKELLSQTPVKARAAKKSKGDPRGGHERIAGDYSVREPPLTIPNREVKPHSADGTAPKRWESRSLPAPYTEPCSREIARLFLLS